MTVKELICMLHGLPSELPVVIRGYEHGVNDVDRIEQVKIQQDVNSEWWAGSHEVVDEDGISAIYIIGKEKPSCI